MAITVIMVIFITADIYEITKLRDVEAITLKLGISSILAIIEIPA